MSCNNTDAIALNQEKDEETFQIEDESSLHHYRTETPNIILDMELDPFEYSLYSHIKRIAGDKGRCNASNRYLAKKSCMSVDKVKKIKKVLAEKKLIRTTVRKNNDNSFQTTLIQIIDWWPMNFKYFAAKKEERAAKLKEFLVGAEKAEGVGAEKAEVGAENIPKEELFKEELINKKKDVASEDAPFLSNYFFKKLKEIRPKRPEPNWYSWNRDIDLLMKQKELSRIDVMALIDFVMDVNNTFVVVSPASLKKKYERIADHIEIEKKRKVAQETAKRDPRMAKTIEVINEYTSKISAGTMGDDYSFIIKPDGGIYHTFEKRNYPRDYDKFMESLKDKGAPESMILRIKSQVNRIN